MLRGLDAHRQALADFQIKRARIDRAADDDVILRINRPSNPDQAAWDAALALAKHTTASGHLLGFHATRLMDHEVEEIRRCGLELLSVDLLQRRLVAAQSLGALRAEQTARLLARHQAADDNRSRMTAFAFTREQLKSQSDFERLFRSWGGEAHYNSHEDDEETGPLLRSLGTPCIVVAALRVADVETHMEVGHRLVNIWCAGRDIVPEHEPLFGGKVRVHMPGESILKIIRLDDPEFVALTKHDKWRRPLS